MKQLIAFCLLLICFTGKAQNPDKVALTAGCELSDFRAEPPNSITSGYQIIEYPYTIYRYAPTEIQLSSPQTKSASLTRTTESKSIIYIFVFILAGISFFFFRTKNKIVASQEINLKTEEDDTRKKQLWDALSEPLTEE